MRILEELWYGNICPNEHPIEKGSEYAQAVHKAGNEADRLLRTLAPDLQKTVGNLLDLQIEASVIAERDALITGFRLAVQIIADSLTTPPATQG